MDIRFISTSILVLMSGVAWAAPDQSVKDPVSPALDAMLRGVHQVEGGELQRHRLTELIGRIAVLERSADPSLSVVRLTLTNKKCLVADAKKPPLDATVQAKANGSITRERALNLNFLSFLATGLEHKDEAKYTLTETSRAVLQSDSDFDANCFRTYIAEYLTARPQQQGRVQFGFVTVAAVWTTNYEVYRSVGKQGDINGWGFVSKSKYLTQVRESQLDHRVVVSLDTDSSVETLISPPKRFEMVTTADAVQVMGSDGQPRPVEYRSVKSGDSGKLMMIPWWQQILATIGGVATPAIPPVPPKRMRIELAPGMRSEFAGFEAEQPSAAAKP